MSSPGTRVFETSPPCGNSLLYNNDSQELVSSNSIFLVGNPHLHGISYQLASSWLGKLGIWSTIKVIVSEVVREEGKVECSMVSEEEDKGNHVDLSCLCPRLPLWATGFETTFGWTWRAYYFLDHMENICFHFGIGKMNDEGTKVTISCWKGDVSK